MNDWPPDYVLTQEELNEERARAELAFTKLIKELIELKTELESFKIF
jgi:hypothetical protein